MEPKEYIEARIERGSDSDCWLWQGALTENGYGRVNFKGRTDYAHRFAYSVYGGYIPRGRHVLHHCDVRHCVNPAHLYAGTHQQNMDDRANRGRTCCGDDHWTRTNPEKALQLVQRLRTSRRSRGDEHWTRKHPERVPRGDDSPARKYRHRLSRGTAVNLAKLDDDKVREIRGLYAAGMRQMQLAAKFGVYQTTISQIVRRKTWTHVSP